MKKQKLIIIAIAAILLAAIALTVVLIAINSDKEGEKYTVTFEANADGVIGMPKNQKIKGGEYVSIPETPSREGYVFYGWFTNPDAEAWSQNPFDLSTFQINEDVTFYAIWYSDELDVDGDGLSHAN